MGSDGARVPLPLEERVQIDCRRGRLADEKHHECRGGERARNAAEHVGDHFLPPASCAATDDVVIAAAARPVRVAVWE
jgi:hypothetical protein